MALKVHIHYELFETFETAPSKKWHRLLTSVCQNSSLWNLEQYEFSSSESEATFSPVIRRKALVGRTLLCSQENRFVNSEKTFQMSTGTQWKRFMWVNHSEQRSSYNIVIVVTMFYRWKFDIITQVLTNWLHLVIATIDLFLNRTTKYSKCSCKKWSSSSLYKL